jgi:putative transposase
MSADLFILRGVPAHIRSDNGPELVAQALRELDHCCRRKDRVHRASQRMGETVTPNRSMGKLRDELLNGEIFYALRKATIVIEAGDATTTPCDDGSKLTFEPDHSAGAHYCD